MQLILTGTLLFLLTTCQTTPKAEEIWRLGWRLNMDVYGEDFSSASDRFDSLLTLSPEPELAFLINGLRAKVQTGESEEAQTIFREMPEDLQNQACPNLDTAIFTLCRNLPHTTVTRPKMQRDLIKMFVADQAVRGNVLTRLIEKYSLDSTAIPSLDKPATQVDLENQEALKALIDEYGFPTAEQVGREAMQGVFFIIQHADANPNSQAAQLPQIEAAVKRGDLDGQRYAYLYDRIQRNKGEPQRYGTQFSKADPISGTFELAKVEDPDNLDRRRRKVGLMPMDTYKEFMRKSLNR